jgi:hypothetical protein
MKKIIVFLSVILMMVSNSFAMFTNDAGFRILETNDAANYTLYNTNFFIISDIYTDFGTTQSQDTVAIGWLATTQTLHSGYITDLGTTQAVNSATQALHDGWITDLGTTQALISADQILFATTQTIFTTWMPLSSTTQTTVKATADAAEVGLGTPAADGYVLSSDTNNSRSWVAPGGQSPWSANIDGAGFDLTNIADVVLDTGASLAVPVIFSGVKTTNQPIADSTYTKVTWASTEWDDAGVLDTATGRFNPNLNGKWDFSVQVKIDQIGVDNPSTVAIYTNGVVARYSSIDIAFGAAGSGFPSVDVTLNLTTNDYVEVFAYQVSTVTRNVIADSTYTWFQGKYIGQ